MVSRILLNIVKYIIKCNEEHSLWLYDLPPPCRRSRTSNDVISWHILIALYCPSRDPLFLPAGNLPIPDGMVLLLFILENSIIPASDIPCHKDRIIQTSCTRVTYGILRFWYVLISNVKCCWIIWCIKRCNVCDVIITV